MLGDKTVENRNIASGSVARRLTLAIILLGIAATLITTGIQTYRDYQAEIDMIEMRIKNIRATHGPSLATSVWHISARQIQIELQGLLNSPGVEFAEIKTIDGDVWRKGSIGTEEAFINLIPLTYSNQGKKTPVGTLTVGSTKQAIYNRLKSKALDTLVYFGLWTFILAGSIFLVFRQLVTRHLDALADYTSSISFDTQAPPLVLNRPPAYSNKMDELEQVASAINSMRTQLADSIQELQESEERFRGFAESSSDFFWEMDENFRFTFISQGTRDQGNFDSVRRIGKTRIELAHENTNTDKWHLHMDDLENHRSFRDFNFETIDHDGRRLCVRVNGSPVFDQTGTFCGYRGTGTDITELKDLENKLLRSQRMEAIGKLTGGVAHDFNNLLGIMIGNTEMLGDKVAGDEKAERHISALTRSVERAAALTNRLLAFSRQQPLTPKSTDVSKLISDIEDFLLRTLGESVDLSFSSPPDLAPALIDPFQLENALINLAINARDAMPSGGKLIIETTGITLDEDYAAQNEEVTPGDYIEVSVSDTGIGMSPEVIESAFEPFFTTKEFGEGSGLGLSMVYGFIKQSNGHISIESQIGKGTTVNLFLPKSEDIALRSGVDGPEPKFAPGTERILVVEDDENVREVPVTTLLNHGYDVVEAENGETAIEHLMGGVPFALLFTDIILPGGMNGMEIATKAREMQPGIKILYTTGYKDDVIVPDDQLDQDVMLLTKPYRRAQLLEKVRMVLDKAT